MSTDILVLRGDEIKEGDTVPKLRLKLLEDGTPFNLGNYAVYLRMKRSDADDLIIDYESMVIEDASRGIVTYAWSSQETADSGSYLIECVAKQAGSQITFPNDTYTKLRIMDSL